MAKAPTQNEERPTSRRIGAMAGLVPFVRPYGARVAAALTALVATAMISLVLPLAVRRVVDGFETSAVELLDSYFLAAFGIAALLALGAGLRYYLVTTLGERVVADIRKAVFDRMVGMSPAFYERIMTGEVLSRITTDTTLVLSVIGSSISIALRHALMLVGALVMLFVTSAKLASVGGVASTPSSGVSSISACLRNVAPMKFAGTGWVMRPGFSAAQSTKPAVV